MDKSKLFQKVMINWYNAVTYKHGKQIPQPYRRTDLSQWAKEAFNNGKTYFCAKPVDSDDTYGKLELCEPEYRYELKHPLTEEEYKELIGE